MILASVKENLSVAETVKDIKAMAEKYHLHPQIRELAVKLIHGAGSKNFPEWERRLAGYFFKNVPYIPDMKGADGIQSPLLTLGLKMKNYIGGDCDCHTAGLLSLLQSIGYNSGNSAGWAFPITISFDKSRVMRHVFIITPSFLIDTSERKKVYPYTPETLKSVLASVYPGITAYKIWR